MTEGKRCPVCKWEWSGDCIECWVTKSNALQARVKELLDSKQHEFECFQKVNAALTEVKLENARLRKQIDDLTWFRDRAIERTVPGIADTTDAVYRLIQDLRKVVDAARDYKKATESRDMPEFKLERTLFNSIDELDGEKCKQCRSLMDHHEMGCP